MALNAHCNTLDQVFPARDFLTAAAGVVIAIGGSGAQPHHQTKHYG
jgi:hypothetical protein